MFLLVAHTHNSLSGRRENSTTCNNNTHLLLCFVCCCCHRSVAAKAAISSADGTKLAAVTEESVDVYNTASGSKVGVE